MVKNGSGKKSKLQRHSMAVFFSNATSANGAHLWWCVITPHAIRTMNFSNSQDRLMASPIIHARTKTIFNVMKAIGIPHHDCSSDYF